MGKHRDITGEKFGCLTAIKMIQGASRNNKIKDQLWLFKCVCGKDYTGRKTPVIKGCVTTCGCRRNRIVDITGNKFGRWKAIRFVEKRGKNKNHFWLFKCDCGTERVIRKSIVILGESKSCGCLHSEINSRRLTTHRMSYSRLYAIWEGIQRRCINTRSASFKLYGARGIKCLWNSFEEFRNDMHESYTEHIKKFGGGWNTTIDRIDKNGNYCRENCRWATPFEQTRNTRRNVMITFNGETKCLMDWSISTGISFGTLHSRIFRYNWTIEEALTIPVGSVKSNQYLKDRIIRLSN